ncbi:MAG: ABC transporter ATP-binding protein [Deltaproteobacteria bacterium]|nr:ABC transporter ATP-binding protein [Deltaproteobacteria bacterium]
MLDIKRIEVRYTGLPVIQDISLRVDQGELVSVVGGNGAGKTTLFKAVMGVLRPTQGQMTFNGIGLIGLKTAEIVRKGIVCIPEDRKLFRPLSVEENLFLGAYVLKDKVRIDELLSRVYTLFPRLGERRLQAAATLSGGEQQMLAIGRGLMSDPKLLLLDEPSLGLAPILVDEVFRVIDQLKSQGMTILLVEQNVREALEICDHGYILQTGRTILEGPGEELLKSDAVQKAFLGL